MWRTMAASAVFGLALLTVTAVGQPPAGGDKKPAEKPKVDTVEAQIAAALANDPDVRMARAKIQLAEAELTRARQLVAQRVVTLHTAIQEQKKTVATVEQSFGLINELHKRGQGPQQELLAAREKLETVQAVLAKLETELRLVTGGGPGGVGLAEGLADPIHPAADAGRAALDWFAARMRAGAPLEQAALWGPIPDRIRAALDKKVKLAPKGESVPLDKALEVFKKEAGLDVPVRGVGTMVQVPVITSEGEELPVGAWLQLYQDWSADGRVYVREYGLLFTHKTTAPPDALTLTQFWKLSPAAKGEMPTGGPEKK
jgi:hypothetical protein